jgi:NADPH:quinone reductase
VLLYNLPMAEHVVAARDLTKWAAAGALVPRLGLNVSLDDIASAHEAVEARRGEGYVTVSPART